MHKNSIPKRLMAMLLSVLTVLSLISPAIPAYADTTPLEEGQPPQTVKLNDWKYESVRFNDLNLGNNVRPRIINIKVDSTIVPIFCADHSKDLWLTGDGPSKMQWTYSGQTLEGAAGGVYTAARPYLEWFMEHYYYSVQLEEAHADELTSDEALRKYSMETDHLDEYYYWSNWSRMCASCYPQCALWLSKMGKLTDENLINAVYEAYKCMGCDPSLYTKEWHKSQIEGIASTSHLQIGPSPIDHWTFYYYTPNNSALQPMIVPAIYQAPDITHEPMKGELVAYKKVFTTLITRDEQGNITSTDTSPIGGKDGVYIGLYSDAACSMPFPSTFMAEAENPKATQNGGQVKFKFKFEDTSVVKDGDKIDLYVKEEQAPAGYSDPEVNPIHVVMTVHEDGPATFEIPGGKNYVEFINEKVKETTTPTPTPTPGSSRAKLKKVDGITGQGLPGATITFYGATVNGFISLPDIEAIPTTAPAKYEYVTDANGEIELQCDTPGAYGYLAPGSYWAVETKAPAGYEIGDPLHCGSFISVKNQHISHYERTETTMSADFGSADEGAPTASITVTQVDEKKDYEYWYEVNGSIVFENFPYRNIQIIKYGPGGVSDRIDGARFNLYKNGKLVTTLTTDSNGQVTYSGYNGMGCDRGFYTIEEISVPAPYVMPAHRTWSVFIDPSDKSAPHTHIFRIQNLKEPDIVIFKRDAVNNQPVPGAYFEVMIDGKSLGAKIGPSDASGRVIISPNTYRQYLTDTKESWTVSVRETEAAPGYLLDDTNWQTQEIKRGNQCTPFTFKDTSYPRILIQKIDSENGHGIADTLFKVQIDGGFETTVKTNGDGIAYINNTAFPKFLGSVNENHQISVTEVSPAPLYNRDLQDESKSYTIVKPLNFGEMFQQFIFKDTHYRSITVTKRDAQTNWPLAEAEFQLRSVSLEDKLNAKAVSMTGITGADGTYTFENIPNGTYEIWESKAPNGYANNTEHKTVIVSSDSKLDQNPIQVEFKNEPKSGLLIRKIDSVTLQPIPGVLFEIEHYSDSTGSKTIQRATDANGVIVLEDIAAGRYTAKELATVDGYILNQTPQSIDVTNQHDSFELTFLNNQTHMLNVQKIDSKTQKPLPGATFSVSTAGGSHVANITTGINGYANLANLEPGSYVVKEIKAPDGHLIDPYPQTFEIKADDAGRVYTLIFEDSPTTKIYIVKHDAQTNAPLAGAEFKVTKSDGKVVADKIVTDKNGIAMVGGATNAAPSTSFDDWDLGETDVDETTGQGTSTATGSFSTGVSLSGGTYYITETRAPSGYILDKTQYSVYVTDGEIKTIDLFNYQPGGIRILKTDAETEAALKGAKFELYDNDTKFLGKYETNAEGYVTVNELDPGIYFLREVEAPKGYQLDSEYRRVEVKAFNITDVVWTNSQLSSLTIQKIDKETKQPVAEAEFEIRKIDGELVKTVITDKSGIATVTHLEDGYYTVVETKAPAGYIINDAEQTVHIQANIPATVTVEEQALKGAVVKKIDAEDKSPLAGAVFEIRDINNVYMATYKTDGSGTFTTAPLEIGFYYLVETTAPDGYILDETPLMFEVKDGIVPTITVSNRRESTIQVYKTDKATGQPLSGAEFTIQDEDGNIVEVITTDATGWAYTTRQQPGNYTLVETKAPDGYVLDSTEHKVTVREGKSATLRITNVAKTVLQIVKVDKDTRKTLAGAVFELSYDTGHGDCTYIGTYTTDANGRIITQPLTPGFYIVKEIKAPDGYALDATFSSRSYGGLANVNMANNEYRYCLTAGETNEIVVEDALLATITIRKIDSVTNKPIPGAVFKVETADHSLVGMFESDANGEAILTGVTAGTYIITETVAPAGYSISAQPQTIVVEYGKNNYVDFKDAENGSLIIDLADKMTGEMLAGGKFTITRCSDNTIVYESVTDMAGSIVVGNLAIGKYIVTQTFAPNGYYMTETQQTVILTAGTQQTLHFFNVTAGIVIEAVNKLTNATIEGVRFQLTRNEDNIVIGEYVTDKDGLALVSGLKPGMYTVEVLAAPDGYTSELDMTIVHVKETGKAHVTFLFVPYAGITVNVIDKNTKTPVSDCIVEIWEQNGELVKSYTTDTTGTFQSDLLAPGYYVLKLISVKSGYSMTVAEATVEIKDGKSVTYTFELVASGTLTVISKGADGKVVPGMKFTVELIDGTRIGEYVTEENGTYTLTDLESGWYVITETAAPEGYTILVEKQNAEVKSNENVEVVFEHDQVFGLQIRTTCAQTGEVVPGATYEIRRLDQSIVGTYTSDKEGLIWVTLEPGWYTVKPMTAPAGYTIPDDSPRNVEVKANEITVTEFVLNQMSSLSVRIIDGLTKKGIYGVRLLLKDGSKTVKEYTTNNEGRIRIEKELLNGGYVLEMISVPGDYIVDSIPKSIDVLVAETTEVTWALYEGAGQIQVYVASADANATLDKPAGSPIQGATFEVMNADTYQVVARMVSDASGIAASSGLPIGRYIVSQIGAGSYYDMSDKKTEVRLKILNDVVRIEYLNNSVNLKTAIAQKSNKTVTAGKSMRVDIITAANLSDVRLDNFFLHIKVPTDAARISTISTGKWNQAVWYSISYKTNMQDYRTMAEHLLSTSKYQYDMSTVALGLQLGEYVTDIRYEFGTVPAGFAMTEKPAYMLYALSTVSNGYKLIARVEIGGQYNSTIATTNGNVGTATYGTSDGTSFDGLYITGNTGVWNTNSNVWTTTVSNKSTPTTLPKTGY